MNILAIGAHPDDVELFCSGTLAKFSNRGDKIFIAIATRGDQGSNDLHPDEIAQIREEEARSSADILKAEFIPMGFSDGFLIDTPESRIKFIDVIRQTSPNIIITHDPEYDYHPDHLITGKIVWNVRTNACAPGIKTKHKHVEVTPDLFFMDTLTGQGFNPQTYVDITSTIEIKRKMLGKHASQMEFMKERYGMPMIEFMEICSGFRGLQANVRFAECFRHSMTYPTGYSNISIV